MQAWRPQSLFFDLAEVENLPKLTGIAASDSKGQSTKRHRFRRAWLVHGERIKCQLPHPTSRCTDGIIGHSKKVVSFRLARMCVGSLEAGQGNAELPAAS